MPWGTGHPTSTIHFKQPDTSQEAPGVGYLPRPPGMKPKFVSSLPAYGSNVGAPTGSKIAMGSYMDLYIQPLNETLGKKVFRGIRVRNEFATG